MKLQCTEMGRIAGNDAMDVIGGAGICKGPMNYMAGKYQSMPVAITVEGANILTRSLIVFGQGLNRAHPNMQDLVHTISDGNDQAGFSKHAWALVGHGASNALSSFTGVFTRSRSKGSDPAKYHEAQLQRLANAFAVCTDLGLVLGGKLKTAECLSGRYADILSNLYLGYSVLWYAKKNPVEETSTIVDYSMTQLLHETEEAFFGIFRNFPIRPIGWLMQLLTFPFGKGAYHVPNDSMVRATSKLITTETQIRSLLTHSVFVSNNPSERVRQIHDALPKCIAADKILSKLRKEKRDATPEEQIIVDEAEELREKIIQVDAFESLIHPHEELVRGTEPIVDDGRKKGRAKLTRVDSFGTELVEEDPEKFAIKTSGTACHNDPHAPRGKDTSAGLGW
eukprot:g1156.t1